MRLFFLTLILVLPLFCGSAKAVERYEGITVLTTSTVTQFFKEFMEALNAGDAEAYETLAPYIRENAKISLETLTLPKKLTLNPQRPSNIEEWRNAFTGFVDIERISISRDVKSTGGRIRVFQSVASNAFAIDPEETDLDITPSGLIFGDAPSCDFQMIVDRDRTLQLTSFVCEPKQSSRPRR